MKISIITPSYNSSDYIEETINSIQNQSYQEFEHIVVDGASQDGTIDILKKYSNIYWISEPDYGQSNAINKGFRLASGDIFAWQNADDLYFPYTFEVVAETFQKYPEIDIIYGDYQIIDAQGNKKCDVNSVDWNLWLFKHGRFVPTQPTAFWRRKVYESVGDLNENLYYCMDLDFFCRAACKQFNFFKVNKSLGQFRRHPNSKTSNPQNDKHIYKEKKTILTRNFHFSFLDLIYSDFFYYRGKLAKNIKLTLGI